MTSTIKDALNQAIDDGNVILADQLATEMIPGKIPTVPEDFAEKIKALAEEKNNQDTRPNRKRFHRRPFILAAALIALFTFATIAYATGLLFPSTGFHNGTSTAINAALDSSEYKAARDYASYLNQNHRQLETTVFDPIDYPVYGDVEKVKKLCQKYDLKYATARTDITSLDQVPSALKENNIQNFLGDSLSGAKANCIFDAVTAFTFNDGNFYMQYILPSDNRDIGDAQIEVAYTPKGSFPWNGFCLSPGEGTNLLNQEQAFSYKTKHGSELICVPSTDKDAGESITGYTCFADMSEGYITVSISCFPSQTSLSQCERQLAAINKVYEKKARKSLGINLKELENRVLSQWNNTAWDQDEAAMEKANLATTDPQESEKIFAKMEAKYSTATPAEKKLYRQWQSRIDKYNKAYNHYPPVNQDLLAKVLETYDF